MAEARAEGLGVTVERLVAIFPNQFTQRSDEFLRLEQQESNIRKQIRDFSAADRLTRDELYKRGGRADPSGQAF